MCVCVHACVCVCVHICGWVWVCAGAFACMFACVHVCIDDGADLSTAKNSQEQQWGCALMCLFFQGQRESGPNSDLLSLLISPLQRIPKYMLQLQVEFSSFILCCVCVYVCAYTCIIYVRVHLTVCVCACVCAYVYVNKRIDTVKLPKTTGVRGYCCLNQESNLEPPISSPMSQSLYEALCHREFVA